MKKRFSILFCLLFVCFMLAPMTELHALAASLTQEYVYDSDNLLTEDEIADLKELCKTKGAEAGVDIILLTKRLSSYDAEKTYMEDFYDEYYAAGILNEHTAMLLVNMELRDVYIQGYGNCEFYLNNDRIEYILDDIIPYLSDADYYRAMEVFIDEVVYYMGQDKGVSFEYEEGQDYGETWGGPSDYYEVSYTPAEAIRNVPFGLIALISLAIGGISLAVMASGSGGKVTTNNRSYMDTSHSGLTAKRDDYIRTSVTKRRKPQENTSSHSGPRSSGGGGISSGGHSHSGGHRGF